MARHGRQSKGPAKGLQKPHLPCEGRSRPNLRDGTWEEPNDFGATSDGDELALVVVERLLDHGAMPLLRYPYLEYDGRKIMRSLADALTKLRELGNLSGRENVEIKTMGIIGCRMSG